MYRATITGLMLTVAFFAMVFLELCSGSKVWPGTVVLLTFGVFATANLGAFKRPRPQRDLYQGFALFGCGYLLLTTGPWFGENLGPLMPTTRLLMELSEYARTHSDEALKDKVAQSRAALKKVDEALSRRKDGVPPREEGAFDNTAAFLFSIEELKTLESEYSDEIKHGEAALRRNRNEWLRSALALADGERERHIGQCLFGLIFGLVGAWIARVLGAQGTDRAETLGETR